jgi:hypothetical protein
MAPCELRSLADGLELETPRSLKPLAAAALLTVPVVALVLRDPRGWEAGLTYGLASALPFVYLLGLRLARRRVVRLTREGGRLFCLGEELELARVETRVALSLVFKVPRAYQLSLWGLTVEGKTLEVRLGERPDLLSASRIAGALEDLLAQSAVAGRAVARSR